MPADFARCRLRPLPPPLVVGQGFVMGPVLGNAVVEVGGFPLGMLVMGGTLLLYAATFAAGGLPGKRPAGVSPEPLLA